MAATLFAALGCMMAAAAPASAELQASNLSGRWIQLTSYAKPPCSDTGCGPTYDFVPCGAGWCGIEVKDGQCRNAAFRLDAGAPQSYGVDFTGRFEKAQETETYAVAATMRFAPPQGTADAPLRLTVRGNTGGTLEAFRRTYPLFMVLVRTGDAACRADPKLSSLD